jgi:hypothetical protein
VFSALVGRWLAFEGALTWHLKFRSCLTLFREAASDDSDRYYSATLCINFIMANPTPVRWSSSAERPVETLSDTHRL